MCPDRQILSAYFDDEVPSPWKERIASHVAECSECGRTLESYGALRNVLHGDAVSVEESAVRMRESLRRYGPAPLWRRHVRLSFAAVVAAAAFVLGGGVTFTLIAGLASGGSGVVAKETVKPFDVTVKVKDVKQLLEILNNQKAIREVTIQLPEINNFKVRGEPTFLKAGEFSGGLR